MRRRAFTADASARDSPAALTREWRAPPATRGSLAALRRAAGNGQVLISPVSAWELKLLARKARIRLDPEPIAWFERVLELPGIRLMPLAVSAAISSSFLAEPCHGDPTDRLLVATARTLSATLVTRAARLLSYASAGDVQALAC